jgi:uncharacterized membrane protein
VADLGRPFRASYLLSGFPPEEIFAALLDVRRFSEWAVGLHRVRALDPTSRAEVLEVRPGTLLEFTLSATGLTHRVVSTVTVVEPPRRLEWRYTEGAVGSGGWLLEEAGPGTVRMTLSTDYEIQPAWLNRIAHRRFFRRATEDLLRRSIRRFGEYLRKD